ncbi:MAG: hypothetical protein JNL98_08585 [Bryobacterales bacterium]|nr:hypothetical protein [Bryobacterales bacterium]
MEPAHFIMLSLYTLAPVLIARYLVRGTWLQVLQAYGLWIATLLVLGFMIGGPHGAGYAWALLIAMFTTVFGVPIFTGILRWRQRRSTRAEHRS